MEQMISVAKYSDKYLKQLKRGILKYLRMHLKIKYFVEREIFNYKFFSFWKA